MYATVVLALTFVPRDLQKEARARAADSGVVAQPTSMREAESQAARTDVAVNALMLVPLALLLAAARWPAHPILQVATCCALAGGIELGQEALSATREGTFADFAWNTAGAAVAVSVVVAYRLIRSAPPAA